MSEFDILRQVDHDPGVRRWTGVFFKPKVNDYYAVPENSGNHPEYRGRSGVCIDVRSSVFGMSWAKIEFFNEPTPSVEYQSLTTAWIRTKYLIPSSHGRPIA